MPSPEQALAHAYTPAEQATVAQFRRLQILGTPDRVRAAIERAVESTGADEVMLATHAYDSAARVRSYELVAAAFA
jgi:alkanesulfonate monooxygenase SsuD/methylene tetrahydromethanopterin reductase-like flavin-dependent oxidoreductase (luciferase family)